MTTVACDSDELKAHCAAELATCRKELDAILQPDRPRDLENTLVPFDRLRMRLGNLFGFVGVLRQVHPDVASREAAEICEQEISVFAHDLDLNRDLFEAVKGCSVDALDDLGRRFVEHVLRDFQRAGVDRDEGMRQEIRRLKEELVGLGQTYMRNIATDVRTVALEGLEDLDGLPPDYVESHTADDGTPIPVTTDYPDYNPFMVYGKSAARRRDLYVAFRQRAFPANAEVLDSILENRFKLAEFLGFPAWADYITEDKMVKKPEVIEEFVARVSEVAERSATDEYQKLLAQKRRDDPDADQVYDWEKSYHEERLKKDAYKVDSKEPSSLLRVPTRPRRHPGSGPRSFSAFVSRLTRTRRAGTQRSTCSTSSRTVRSLGTSTSTCIRVTGSSKHCAMFPMTSGVRGLQVPSAALVCNFANPNTANGAPALLEHDDVVTFFHEFGHLIHHLFGGAQDWYRFSGIATEWDFVEVPSQLYEEWAWDYDVLQRFAVHAETREKIPKQLVESMRRARAFGRGLWVRHQMFYAALSLTLYQGDPSAIDTDVVTRELQNRYSFFPYVEDTHFQASFGHLDDYSALYYTYMWSLVIAQDFLREFKRDGVLSHEMARRYREVVLAPGGTKDAVDLVGDFLGREYSFGAFESWLHGGEES